MADLDEELGMPDDLFRQKYPLIARPPAPQQPVNVRGVSLPQTPLSEPTPPALAPQPTGATPNLPPPKPVIPSSPLQQKTEQDQRTQQELGKGSGVAQFSAAHPTAGKFLRGLNVAGELAGIASPPIALALRSIPGTEEHHNQLVKENTGALNADTAQAEKTALTGEAQARTEETKAKTGLTEAQTKVLGEPKPKEEKWDAFTGFTDKDGTPLIREENSGQVVRANDKQQPTGFMPAKPPTPATVPLTEDQAKQRNAIWDPILTKNKLPSGVFKAGMTDGEAKELEAQLNNATGKTQAGVKIDLGQGTQGNARSDRSYTLASKRLDDTRKPIEAIQQRVGRLNDTLAQKNPQADALVAPELLSIMSGGQGSGLRMNEAEIARIVGGRSAWETLKANIQHWSTDPEKARSITADQDKQIHALVQTVQQKLTAKQAILDAADEALMNTEDVKQHRAIVADTKKKLDAIDAGAAQQGGGIEVKDPTGKTHTFSDQKSADAFKKAAGIQ